MNLSKVDLNLFIVFDAIYTEANLTRAGQIVGITQPAVSNALSRLRETFNDPLFVRTAQGMVPTPMAQNIIGPVRNALSLLRTSVQESRIFTPLQASKTFRISMTDLTEAVILPPLFQRLRRLAPALVIESFLCKRRETTKELAAGRLDFAVDAPLNTDPQVRHVKLMQDDMVMTVPERFARRHQLRHQPLPVEVPALETHLYWHESTDQDPANRWMREQIIELCERVVAQDDQEQASPAIASA